MRLTSASARALMLAAQGMLDGPSGAARKADVLQAIRRMGALQIDTINVVARSPYLVLWSRLGAQESAWLDQLLAEGALFEYWAHAACLLPIEDYPLYRRLMLERAKGWRSSHDWLAAHAAEVERLLAHIRERGPVRSADFERLGGRSNGWWDWKPEKLALEHLHNVGVLMTARRERFQRVYDLRERVLPNWDDADAPSLEVVWRELTLKTVRALGITTARWAPDYFRLPGKEVAKVLKALAAEGIVFPVEVEGWEGVAYVHADHRTLAEAAAEGALVPTRTTLLSPFDPLVWDRARARAVFGFDYLIESYTPAAKRRYGYFTLPILHHGALAGRLDPKAQRGEGRFEVKAVHLEPDVAVTEELIAELAGALQACADWHKTPEVVVGRSDPPGVAERLAAALSAGKREISQR